MAEPTHTRDNPEPIKRFFAAALMAIGGLIALLCGLCTLGWTGFVIVALTTSRDKSTAAAFGGTLLITLFVGVLPTLFGVGLFVAGRGLRRPNPPRTGTPPPLP